MTEFDKQIRTTVQKFFLKDQPSKQLTREQLDMLFELEIIKKPAAIAYCVNQEYWELRKGSDISTRSCIIDLSIRWQMCESNIKNIIYKKPAK